MAGSALVAAPPLLGQSTKPTAQQVVERIQKSIGGSWQEQSLDTFKAGDPATQLTGIATTGMATIDVLTRASKAKANLVVTLEPVFFSRTDALPSRNDAVFAAKKEFIEKNGLVVWRFTDHWRARKPDPFAAGMAQALSWGRYQVDGDPLRYDLPETTLGSLVDDLTKRLQARAGIRVVGDPQARVKRIALLPGVSALAATMKSLPECDVVVAGETREWESVEYAQDTVASGRKKGLIMLGRLLSEEPGMKICADWLKGLIPEVAVSCLPAGDPYWRPA
jgi:putative NIF3 family GTP cyclohydrolase 1 type 2